MLSRRYCALICSFARGMFFEGVFDQLEGMTIIPNSTSSESLRVMSPH